MAESTSNALVEISGSQLAQYRDLFDQVNFAKRGGGNNIKKISIRGGMFRLVDGKQELQAIEDRFLRVIVINDVEKVQREYYAAAYQEGVDSEMTCWSEDGERPRADVPNPPSKSCASCPKNQPGSGANGSRACRYAMRLAVVLANNPGGDVLQLKLPAKSIFGTEVVDGDRRSYLAYRKQFAAAGLPMQCAVTELKFNPKEPVPVLTFKTVAPVAESDIQHILAQSKSEMAMNAVKMVVFQKKADDMPEAKAAAPAASATPKAAPKAMPTGKGAAAHQSALDAWQADE